MIEVWKDINLYEGCYAISNVGSVMNTRNGNILKCDAPSADYKRVLLCKNGYSKFFQVNRLVAIHYVPNPLNKPIVHHIDENKWNNIYTNLLWATPAENTKYHYDFEREKQKPFVKGKIAKVIGTNISGEIVYVYGQNITIVSKEGYSEYNFKNLELL